MICRVALLFALAFLVLPVGHAPAELIIDIGGPGLPDQISIVPGSDLVLDVTISSSTPQAGEAERVIDYLLAFESFAIDPASQSFLEFLPVSEQSRAFADDPAYIFANDSFDVFFDAYSTLPGGPLDGLDVGDTSQQYVDNPADPDAGTLITETFLLARIRLRHQLNGADPQDVNGEAFEITLPPYDPDAFVGVFEDGFIPLPHQSNTLTVTTIPEPGSLALGGLVSLACGVGVIRRRRLARRS